VDHLPPGPRGMPRGERFGPDLIDVVTARRLAPDDPPGALDGAGVVDTLPAVADSEHGPSCLEMVPRPAGSNCSRLGCGGWGSAAGCLRPRPSGPAGHSPPSRWPGSIQFARVGARVNVNTATAAELEALPGIGPVLARRIIEGRPYWSVDELERVKG